jgi:hypothetical protein
MARLWQQLIPARQFRVCPNLHHHLAMLGGHGRALELYFKALLKLPDSTPGSADVKAATPIANAPWEAVVKLCRQKKWTEKSSNKLWSATTAALKSKYNTLWNANASAHGFLAAILLNVQVGMKDEFDGMSVEAALGQLPIALDAAGSMFRLRTSVATIASTISDTEDADQLFHGSINTLMREIAPSPEAVGGSAFEKLTAQYLLVLKVALAELHRSAPKVFERVNLGDLFRNGLYANGAASLQLPSPFAAPKSPIEKLSAWFPTTPLESSQLAELTSGRTVVVNGRGAPFADVFTYFVPTPGSPRDSIRLWVQCKAYQKVVVKIDSSDTGSSVAAEVEKVQSKLATVPLPDSGAAAKDVFLLFSYGRLHGGAGDSDDVRRSNAGEHPIANASFPWPAPVSPGVGDRDFQSHYPAYCVRRESTEGFSHR